MSYIHFIFDTSPSFLTSPERVPQRGPVQSSDRPFHQAGLLSSVKHTPRSSPPLPSPPLPSPSPLSFPFSFTFAGLTTIRSPPTGNISTSQISRVWLETLFLCCRLALTSFASSHTTVFETKNTVHCKIGRLNLALVLDLPSPSRAWSSHF